MNRPDSDYFVVDFRCISCGNICSVAIGNLRAEDYTCSFCDKVYSSVERRTLVQLALQAAARQVETVG